MSRTDAQPDVNVILKGHVIAYDLPAEDRTDLKKIPEAYHKVANARIRSTTALHALGLCATQSVVLTTKPETVIKETFEKVHSFYQDANAALRILGIGELGEPDLRPIKILEAQYMDFKSLAEAKLSKSLDKTINDLAALAQSIENLTGEARDKVIESLNRKEKPLTQAQALAKELGVDLSDKFSLVEQLTKTVYAKAGISA